MGCIKTDREKRVAQILATDTTREQLADALWCAEDCVRRLGERVSLLNDKISKLRTEFDKMDKWHSVELQAAMVENSKLRELVSDMLPFVEVGLDYVCVNRRCHLFDECKSDASAKCAIEERMQSRVVELGIEGNKWDCQE